MKNHYLSLTFLFILCQINMASAAGIRSAIGGTSASPITIIGADPQTNAPPEAPRKLYSSNLTSHSVTISFYDRATFDTKNILLRQANEGTWHTIYTWGPLNSSASHTDKGLESAVKYRYRVITSDGTYSSSSPALNVVTHPCDIEHNFIQDWVANGEQGWHNETQGITHDDRHWFISQNGDYPKIWKIPVTTPLTQSIGCGNGVNCRTIYQSPGINQQGYNHFGDMDYKDGLLYVAIEQTDHSAPPGLAIYDSQNLAYLTHAPFQFDANYDNQIQDDEKQTHSAFVVVDKGGYVYSANGSNSFCDPRVPQFCRLVHTNTHKLRKYQLNQIKLQANIAQIEITGAWDVDLVDEYGKDLELYVPQGGVFSPDNLLYLNVGDGKRDCSDVKNVVLKDDKFQDSPNELACGIQVFKLSLANSDQPCWSRPGRCIARRIDQSHKGGSGFVYDYDPGGANSGEEPEGLTYWDLSQFDFAGNVWSSTKNQEAMDSHLHVIMLDNSWIPWNDDKVFIKNFQIAGPFCTNPLSSSQLDIRK